VRIITRALLVQHDVVGDELLARHHRLDHRVAAAADLEPNAVVDISGRT
jgi:hypothetical protein